MTTSHALHLFASSRATGAAAGEAGQVAAGAAVTLVVTHVEDPREYGLVEYAPDGQPMVLAMAYVPMQVLNTLYDPEEGFCQGTIFPELNKPWLVGGVNCG